MRWFEQLPQSFGELPWQAKAAMSVGGVLISAFSGQLPPRLQEIGLYTGLLLFIIGVGACICVGWRRLSSQTRDLMKDNVIIISALSIIVWPCLLLMIYFWYPPDIIRRAATANPEVAKTEIPVPTPGKESIKRFYSHTQKEKIVDTLDGITVIINRYLEFMSTSITNIDNTSSIISMILNEMPPPRSMPEEIAKWQEDKWQRVRNALVSYSTAVESGIKTIDQLERELFDQRPFKNLDFLEPIRVEILNISKNEQVLNAAMSSLKKCS
jgi:hypothetical protein